jgi:hypothetical protein
MRHELDWRSVRTIGTVWFSYGGNRWLRRTGPANWNVEQVATDEDVWLLWGRRYAKEAS